MRSAPGGFPRKTGVGILQLPRGQPGTVPLTGPLAWQPCERELGRPSGRGHPVGGGDAREVTVSRGGPRCGGPRCGDRSALHPAPPRSQRLSRERTFLRSLRRRRGPSWPPPWEGLRVLCLPAPSRSVRHRLLLRGLAGAERGEPGSADERSALAPGLPEGGRRRPRAKLQGPAWPLIRRRPEPPRPGSALGPTGEPEHGLPCVRCRLPQTIRATCLHLNTLFCFKPENKMQDSVLLSISIFFSILSIQVAAKD